MRSHMGSLDRKSASAAGPIGVVAWLRHGALAEGRIAAPADLRSDAFT